MGGVFKLGFDLEKSVFHPAIFLFIHEKCGTFDFTDSLDRVQNVLFTGIAQIRLFINLPNDDWAIHRRPPLLFYAGVQHGAARGESPHLCCWWPILICLFIVICTFQTGFYDACQLIIFFLGRGVDMGW